MLHLLLISVDNRVYEHRVTLHQVANYYDCGIRVIIFASISIIVRFNANERVSDESLQARYRLLVNTLIQSLPRWVLTRGQIC